MNAYEAYQHKERELMQKALQLAGPVHPAYNMAPILDLVRQADALGFDLIPRNPALASQQSF